jgi:predicted acetyltransferase
VNITLEPLRRQDTPAFSALFLDHAAELMALLDNRLTRSQRFDMAQKTLERYVTKSDCWGFLICADGSPADFCLLRYIPGDEPICDVEQFYVDRAFRREGVGQFALQSLLQRFSGKWQIRVLENNGSGLAFWQRSLEGRTRNGFTTAVELDGDQEMVFIRFRTG